jgi:hypothetical protein
MRLYLRGKTSGAGFNMRPRNGSIPVLKRIKMSGQGIGEDFYEKNVSNPAKNVTSQFERLSIKPKKAKKYITLNL